MVDLFERVTLFVLKVAQFRTAEYHRQHPTSRQRQAWSAWREENVGVGEGRTSSSYVYLDDAQGISTLDEGEELVGGCPRAPVRLSLHLEPSMRVKLSLFIRASRPQIDLAIAARTFQEAGWGIATDKLQLGSSIDILGFTLSVEGDGALMVPEAKKHGMIEDIEAQQAGARETAQSKHSEVERLVGRCINLATAIVEANPYMTAMYRMKEAKVVVRASGRRIRVAPKFVATKGHTPALRDYQRSLAWWKHALESEWSAPLAPKLIFPGLDEPGVAFAFTDAAREDGTGFGGFSLVTVGGELSLLYINPRWSDSDIRALQENELSMPAGEGIGAVVLIDALAAALEGLAYIVIFTDSSPVAEALNSNNSASPQLNTIVRWVFDQRPNLQIMAIHWPGRLNRAADGLSRSETEIILAEARDAGARCTQISMSSALPLLLAEARGASQRIRAPTAAQAK